MLLFGGGCLLFTLWYVLFPFLIERLLLAKLPSVLGYPVEVRRVVADPFRPRIEIQGFLVRDSRGLGTLFAFDRLSCSFSPAQLLRGRVVPDRVELDNPYLHIIRRHDGLTGIIPSHGSAQSAGNDWVERLLAADVMVSGGILQFDDEATGDSHSARDIAITIPGLGGSGKGKAEPRLAATIDSGIIEAEGQVLVSGPGEVDLHVVARGIDLSGAVPYLPSRFRKHYSLAPGKANFDVRLGHEGHAGHLVLTGSVEVHAMRLSDETGSIASLPKLRLGKCRYDFKDGSLFLGEAYLDSPRLSLVRNKRGELNVASLLPGVPEKESSSASLSLGMLRLTDGLIRIRDDSPEQSINSNIEIGSLAIEGLSSHRNEFSRFTVQGKADGAGFSSSGRFRLSPLLAEGAAEVRGLSLERYGRLFGSELPLDIAGATLSGSTKFIVEKPAERASLSLSSLNASLEAIGVKNKGGAEFFHASRLRLEDCSLASSTRDLRIGRLLLDQPWLRLERTREGVVAPVGVQLPHGPASGTDAGWAVLLENAALTDGMVRMTDRSIAGESEHVAHIQAAEVKGYDSRTGRAETSLSLALDSGGALQARGRISVSPLSASLRLSCKDLNIKPFRPYLPESLGLVPVDGTADAEGTLSVSPQQVPADAHGVSYDGEVAFRNVVLHGRGSNTRVLAVRLVKSSRLSVGVGPEYLNAKDVLVQGMEADLRLMPSGMLNVQAMLTQDNRGEAGDGPARGRGLEGFKQFKMESISIQDSSLRFTDETVRPAFQTLLTGLKGNIEGLNMDEAKPADLNLTATQQGYSPVSLRGKILPLRRNLLIDVQAVVRDMDMVQISPYSRKLFGHTIRKGKASFDLAFRIDSNLLDARNSLVLDNVDLGDRESDAPIDLPIKFFLAVLEDSNGEIALDIPIRGRLDSPEFSLSGVLSQFFIDLFQKIASSPLAFLGLPFGGSRDSGLIEFASGDSLIAPSEAGKLDELAKIMNEKPRLSIELSGFVEPDADRLALQKGRLLLLMKEQKFKELLKKGDASTSVETLAVVPSEYGRLLEQVYKESGLPMDRNSLNIESFPSQEVMESRLAHDLVISDDDLRAFALKRAAMVREYLVSIRGVAPGRIFLESPESLAPQGHEDAKKSRVQIRLR